MGDFPNALASYDEAHQLARKLAAEDADNLERQRDVAVTLDMIGDILKAKGDLPAALEAHEEVLAISRRLAEAAPSNTQWQHDLSIGLVKVADGLATKEDLTGALRLYHEGLKVRRALAAKDESNLLWLREVATSLNRIGDLLVAESLGSWSNYQSWNVDKQGDLSGKDLGPALEAYAEGLDINRRLVDKDPRNTQWQLDVSISLDRIGDLLAAQGNLSGAIENYRESRDIRRAFVAKDESNARWQIALAASLANLGQIGDDPLKNTADAIAILKRLQSQGLLPATQVDWIKNMEADLAKLNAEPKPDDSRSALSPVSAQEEHGP
jgi:tetratricopeptide (TPR) repeat protein